MSRYSLTQMETIAVLLNDGYIQWRKPKDPGRSTFKVFVPGKSSKDKYIGRLSDVTPPWEEVSGDA